MGRVQIMTQPCLDCGRTGLAHSGAGLCGRCYTKLRRLDPEKVEQDKVSSRRWKALHNYKGKPPGPRAGPAAVIAKGDPLVRCHKCGEIMLHSSETKLCGFCEAGL